MRTHRPDHTGNHHANIGEWYQTPLGQLLLDELQIKVEPILATSFGYYALQLGCASGAHKLLQGCRVRHRFNLGASGDAVDVLSLPSSLPIADDSIDLVVLMHSVSLADEPHDLLREVSRILIPQGKLIIIDFNPLSLWGLRCFFQSWLEQLPWMGHYFTVGRLTDWMRLLGFERKHHVKVGYFPPVQRIGALQYLSWLEKATRNCFRFSSALNVLVYDKKSVPMTPIKYNWVNRAILGKKVTPPSAGRNMK